MSGLARDKYYPLVYRDSGDKTYPIWLLINPKYPSVINNIWRHVLDEIQDIVYRKLQFRIDTSNIYIRNVVSDCGIVPNTLNWWCNEAASEIKILREIIVNYHPKLLITFGGFPFEFVRRVFEINPQKGPKYWSVSMIKDEFETSIEKFDINKSNVIPLLRRVIVCNKLYESEPYNYENYNDLERYSHYVGLKLSEIIIRNKDCLNIWIK